MSPRTRLYFTSAVNRIFHKAGILAENERTSGENNIKNSEVEFGTFTPVSISIYHFLAALFTEEESHLQDFFSKYKLSPDLWHAKFPELVFLSELLAKKQKNVNSSVKQRLTENSKLDTPLSFSLENAIQHAAAEFSFQEPLEISSDLIFYGLAKTAPDISEFLNEHHISHETLYTYITHIHHYENTALSIPEIHMSDSKIKDVSHQETEITASSEINESSQSKKTEEPPLQKTRDDSLPVCEFQEIHAPKIQIKFYRLLDAAADRAGEALRVLEDYVRFILDDGFLSREMKNMRHLLAEEISRLSMTIRLTCRDTLTDVGTQISTKSEFYRENVFHVLTANFSRLQESLRSLEEFSKISFPESSKVYEALRYQSYTLQKAVFFSARNNSSFRVSENFSSKKTSLTEHADLLRQRLSQAKLYILTDGASDEESFRKRIDACITSGTDILQLRDKKAEDQHLLHLAKIIRTRISELNATTIFIMNDRPDIAMLAGADGVHVGQEELSIRDIRTLCGPEKLIGLSTHTLSQAHNALLAGADYIGVGPTFPSSTKTFTNFPGLELLRNVAAEIRLPAFAIGGISLNNLEQVISAGFTRVAISSAVTLQKTENEITDTIKAIKNILEISAPTFPVSDTQ
ncbi:MAG: thiamine phosphate synthase [Planctomycetia bacterium]|nr:thiamine phosphate synthase [Planctomycetia bacterium]